MRETMRQIIVQGNMDKAAAAIANGESQSNIVDVTPYGARNFVVVLTNGWTDADLGFLVSYDNVIWSPLYKADGTRALFTTIGTIVAVASRALFMAETYALGNAMSIVIESLDTTTGALLVQGADRAIQLAPLY